MQSLADALFLDDDLRAFRRSADAFVAQHLSPYVQAWEDAGTFPRDVYRAMAQAELLGVGFPEELGGAGGDLRHVVLLAEALTRSGSPGLAASLGSHLIAVPPILYGGTSEQQRRFVPPVLRGEQIAALGITEPGGGSDVASLRTRAVRDGDGWRIDGTKTFITSGSRADFVTVAARTGGEGASGISVFVVPSSAAGFSVVRTLDKLGWQASDTAELSFDNVYVPDDHRIGPVDGAFGLLMQNFAAERLVLAAQAVEIAQMAWREAHGWALQREAFGRPIAKFQVLRHRLAEMATAITQCQTFVWGVVTRVATGDVRMAEVAMVKNAATDMASQVVDQALQIHGGAGYMRGTLVERLYRDVRLYPIGGGTREIMNELIARVVVGG